jgi:hypothetical protein
MLLQGFDDMIYINTSAKASFVNSSSLQFMLDRGADSGRIRSVFDTEADDPCDGRAPCEDGCREGDMV